MTHPLTTAALTLSLTGPFARQGTEAAESVRLWAQQANLQLTVVDDSGSAAAAAQAYARWMDGVDLLLGPCSSGLVRATASLVCDGGRVLWNHGGSADDLARPGLASLPATTANQAGPRSIPAVRATSGSGVGSRWTTNQA